MLIVTHRIWWFLGDFLWILLYIPFKNNGNNFFLIEMSFIKAANTEIYEGILGIFWKRIRCPGCLFKVRDNFILCVKRFWCFFIQLIRTKMSPVWNLSTLEVRILSLCTWMLCDQYKTAFFSLDLLKQDCWSVMTLKYRSSMISSSIIIDVINRINTSNPALRIHQVSFQLICFSYRFSIREFREIVLHVEWGHRVEVVVCITM